jgi:hypothetical protein
MSTDPNNNISLDGYGRCKNCALIPAECRCDWSGFCVEHKLAYSECGCRPLKRKLVEPTPAPAVSDTHVPGSGPADKSLESQDFENEDPTPEAPVKGDPLADFKPGGKHYRERIFWVSDTHRGTIEDEGPRDEIFRWRITAYLKQTQKRDYGHAEPTRDGAIAYATERYPGFQIASKKEYTEASVLPVPKRGRPAKKAVPLDASARKATKPNKYTRAPMGYRVVNPAWREQQAAPAQPTAAAPVAAGIGTRAKGKIWRMFRISEDVWSHLQKNARANSRSVDEELELELEKR